jgi:MAF protein
LAFFIWTPESHFTHMALNLVLASRSPRRRELIQLLGCSFESMAADVDEGSMIHADPALTVVQISRLKANTVLERFAHKADNVQTVIVAADTIVTLDGQMLGKPDSEADAWRMLRLLRGRTHHVYTGLTLVDVGNDHKMDGSHVAAVTMREYTDEEIAAYVATGDPMDKAGAYAIQHPIFRPVKRLDGCFTGVMGLSVCHLIQMLCSLDIATAADMKAIFRAHQRYRCPIYEELNA